MATAHLKLGEDQYQNKLQVAHVDSASYQLVTTAVQWDTTQDRIIRITPTGGDSWVKITAATNTPATSEGMYITGTEYFIIRKNEWIGASAAINVLNASEL